MNLLISDCRRCSIALICSIAKDRALVTEQLIGELTNVQLTNHLSLVFYKPLIIKGDYEKYY
jgi:hypothetical protein